MENAKFASRDIILTGENAQSLEGRELSWPIEHIDN
jgi:hypothetical protein